MLVVGVTGGICSGMLPLQSCKRKSDFKRFDIGKSTQTKWLASNYGVPVIDADALGHKALNPKSLRI